MKKPDIDNLEHFVENNRDLFDYKKPDAALWDRIEAELPDKKSLKRKETIGLVMRIAAVLAIVLAIAVLQKQKNEQNPHTAEQTEKNGANIPELVEAEQYYGTMVNQMMNEVDKHLVNCPELREDLVYDINELDTIYAELKRDLSDDIANQEVVDALIQNYRLKIEILEDLLEQLNRTNEIKCDNNEAVNL